MARRIRKHIQQLVDALNELLDNEEFAEFVDEDRAGTGGLSMAVDKILEKFGGGEMAFIVNREGKVVGFSEVPGKSSGEGAPGKPNE
jgi:hypothetical protein